MSRSRISLGLALAASLVTPALVAPDARSAVQLPPVRDVRLPNGARLVLAEKRDVPLIAFQATLRGGSLTDPAGKEGTASLTAEMIRKGAGKRSAQRIAAIVDSAGARLATGASMEHSWVAGEFLARDEGLMVELLRDLLRAPTFPDSEFTKLKQQSIDAVRSAKDNPNSVLAGYGLAFFFADHPYGRPVSGDETTLARITREDVLEAYRGQYGGDRLIVTAVGDFDAARAERRFRDAFADWGRAEEPLPAVPEPRRSTGRRVLLVDKPDATQTYFWIANLGVSRTDPDRDRIDVANTALGGRFTSMLNTALRLQSGLTYGARSRLIRWSRPGPVAITSYTKTESTQRALDLALETLARFRETGIDSATLASIQAYLGGLHPTDLETGDQIAGALADLAIHDLPQSEVTDYVERIAAIRRAELPPVIRRVYPPREDLVMVLIGNASRARPVARRYGRVVEVRYDQPLLEAVRSAGPTRAPAGARRVRAR